MSTRHFRTTAPMPIESIDGVRTDSRRFSSLDELREHFSGPIPLSAFPEPLTGLRKRLRMTAAPTNLRERLGLEPPAKTLRERLLRRRKS